jgi:hypothetical protein
LLLEDGEADEAVTVRDELLGTDPCRKTGHQLLMCAYAALGQPQLTSAFRLYCCGKPAAIVGFDPLGEYQWYA